MVTSEFRGRVELDERENLSLASLKIEEKKTQKTNPQIRLSQKRYFR